MIVYKNREHQALTEASIVALGTFDGMHKGHLAVINRMVEEGERCGLKKVVFTFSDIPKHRYNSTTSKIMSNLEKLDWLEQMGVDLVVSLPFDATIKNVSHFDFFNYICEQLNASTLVIGENFKFGKSALGTAQWLQEQCRLARRGCIIVSAITFDGQVISSTNIRELLMVGKIAEANARLGRKHFVSGVVKMGKQVGKALGFATANLTIRSYMTNIKPGVYVTETVVANRRYQSVSNVGYNPTFKQHDFNLETHILDFADELYGQKISVYFLARLRDELTFENTTALIEQIEKDVTATRRYFDGLTAQ